MDGRRLVSAHRNRHFAVRLCACSEPLCAVSVLKIILHIAGKSAHTRACSRKMRSAFSGECVPAFIAGAMKFKTQKSGIPILFFSAHKAVFFRFLPCAEKRSTKWQITRTRISASSRHRTGSSNRRSRSNSSRHRTASSRIIRTMIGMTAAVAAVTKQLPAAFPCL